MRFKSIIPCGGQPTPTESHSTSKKGVEPARCHFPPVVSIESFLKILNHIIQYSGLRSASSHFLTSGFPHTRAFPRSQSTFSTGRGDDGSHIDGYLQGEGRIGPHVIQYSLSKTLWPVLDTFPKTAWTRLLTGFLKPQVPFLYPWHGRRPEFSSVQLLSCV